MDDNLDRSENRIGEEASPMTFKEAYKINKNEERKETNRLLRKLIEMMEETERRRQEDKKELWEMLGLRRKKKEDSKEEEDEIGREMDVSEEIEEKVEVVKTEILEIKKDVDLIQMNVDNLKEGVIQVQYGMQKDINTKVNLVMEEMAGVRAQMERKEILLENRMSQIEKDYSDVIATNKSLISEIKAEKQEGLNQGIGLILDKMNNEDSMIMLREKQTEVVKFNAMAGESPIQHLESLENLFKIGRWTDNEKMAKVNESLQEAAKDWWRTLKSKPKTFMEYKREIMNVFWNEGKQDDIMDSIATEKYGERKDEKLIQFLFRQMARIQELDAVYLTESQIMRVLRRNLPADVRHVMVGRDWETMEDMTKILKAVDLEQEEKHKEQNSHTYRKKEPPDRR